MTNNLEGKVLGIPLVLIILILGIVALVDIPMLGMFRAQKAEVQKCQQVKVVEKVVEVTPVVSPVVSPGKQAVSTQSGKIK